MANYFILAFNAINYLLLPLVKLASYLRIAFSPAIHLASLLCRIFVSGPLSVLARFETMYIFLGSAALLGIFAGSVLHVIMMVLVNLLSLENESVKDSTFEDGRRLLPSRSRKQAYATPQLTAHIEGDAEKERDYPIIMESSGGYDRQRIRGGLLAQTILEEDDSDES